MKSDLKTRTLNHILTSLTKIKILPMPCYNVKVKSVFHKIGQSSNVKQMKARKSQPFFSPFLLKYVGDLQNTIGGIWGRNFIY